MDDEKEIDIIWTELDDFVHPAQDFKVKPLNKNSNMVSNFSQIMFVTQTLIVKSFKEEKGGKRIPIEKAEQVCITSQKTMSVISEDELIEGYKILIKPTSFGGDRWTRKSIQKFLSGNYTNPTFQEVYGDIISLMKNYFDFPDERYFHVITCWIIGTYYFQIFNTYPILYLNAVKRAGKSKLLTFISLLAFNAVDGQDFTSSTIFRLAHLNKCSILIDELENIRSKEKVGLRLLLNNRYKKGKQVPRAEQEGKNKSFNVNLYSLYGPTAIANISGLDNVLEDRAITLILQRSTNTKVLNSEIPMGARQWQEIRDKLYMLMLSDQSSDLGSHVVSYLNNYFKLPEVVNGVSVVSVVKKQDPIIEHKLRELLKRNDTNDEKFLYGGRKTNDTNDTNDTLIHEKGVVSPKKGVVSFLETTRISELKGRYLELWKPLLVVASCTHPKVFDLVINFAVDSVEMAKMDDVVDNIDAIVIEKVVKLHKMEGKEWISVNDIKNSVVQDPDFSNFNSRSVGRVLKRLGLNTKRRKRNTREYFVTEARLKVICLKLGLYYKDIEPDEDVEEQKTMSDPIHGSQVGRYG